MADPLLRDLTVYDTEGTRWAVLQRWMSAIVTAVEEGGGGGSSPGIKTAAFYAGNAVLNNLFGYFKAPVAMSLSRAQIFCQTPPVGAALNLTIMVNGASSGDIAVVADGSPFQETVFGSAISLNAGDVVQFKITQLGSGTPGGYFTANLL